MIDSQPLSTPQITRAAMYPERLSLSADRGKTRRDYVVESLQITRPEWWSSDYPATTRDNLVRSAMQQIDAYLKSVKQEKTMSAITNPQQPPRADNAPRLPHVAQTSAALEEVKALKMLVRELQGELRAVSESLHGARDELKALRTLLVSHDESGKAAWSQLQAAPQSSPEVAGQAAAPVAPAHTQESQYTEILEATELRPAVMKNGKVYARVFGGRYSQYGVPLYPEHYNKVGVDATKLAAGAQPFVSRVVVEMRVSAKGELQPYRVVGLAQ